MKYPIARYDTKNKNKKEKKYLLYDTKTGKTVIMSAKEIEGSAEDIRGFRVGGNLAHYYSNLGYIGKEQPNDGIKYNSVIQENVYINGVGYEVVDRNGFKEEIEKKQLIVMLEQGHQIAGARIVNGILKVTSEIEEVHKKGTNCKK